MRQIDVARLLACPRPKISQWESGAKHPLPWTLDLLTYVYGLTPYESWMLFFEAGYTTMELPSPIIAIIRSWGRLPPHLQEAGINVLRGAADVLTNWTILDQEVGDSTVPRSIPTPEDVDRFWRERGGSRYHSRRFDALVRSRDRPGPTPRLDG
jgi:hypothetical protein